ncbi:MAG: NDP-sugar synthase [Patescibacteria group bacterium]
MKAIILAAGVGSRLHPLTLETPKPLIEVAGKPIIERIFKSLPEEITEVVIVVEHLKDKIKSHVGYNFFDRKVIYVEEGEKKGTFGALLSAKEVLGEDRFLVLNGDDLHAKHELEKFLTGQRMFGLQKMVMPNYYSVLVENDLVMGFRAQTDEEKGAGALIATGAYTLDSKIFDHPGVEVFGGEYGLPQTILAQKDSFPIRAVITEKWLPINSFADLEKANKLC